ncbi:WAT1-related protein At3g18200 isoform X2 [Amborella trichopoda]|uniref:WAT1-related protein At3g18200 isoform X2 n=1 Tax=Amborella trichopoda TaxID=13333 RepID=UPI0009BFEB43|nr:WAT1-related protein At3g18200 isoform X2 [Amborella trichopoda]|eukprot:XP_020523681.1 WAT1-related protein At3g18200 isoform X2 [Amborella trichopoda]
MESTNGIHEEEVPSSSVTNGDDGMLWDHPNSKHNGIVREEAVCLENRTALGARAFSHCLRGSFNLPGIIITGLSFYVETWCLYKKGPVFKSAFSPLLIVFSFILDTIAQGSLVNLRSLLAAVMVVGGLYMLLWAKAHDNEEGTAKEDESLNSLLSPE